MTRLRNARTSPIPLWAALTLLALFSTTFASPLNAAEAPRIQVFGGYSRLQFDSKSLNFTSNTVLNGGAFGAAFNLIPQFGVVGEVHVQNGPNLRSRDWLFGPQVMYNRWGALFFAHALFGKAETRVSTTVLQEDNGRATALGGGVDYAIFHRFSLRVVQVDYLTTHTIGADQKNLRFSTGLVFRLGRVSTRPRPKL
jgi:hypothetical protein